MIDYKILGFKCGIEVHNRLATKHKLFCNCPARFSAEKPYRIVVRKLRPVAGELGQIDIAAMHEYFRDRIFYYQVFSDNVCLVELDEEPPHELNEESLNIALQIAKLLKAEIPNEIHIMRKTVIDGSNTAGFQRTAIVGMNGILKTSLGDVRITNISLEEEAAGIVEQKGNEVTYRLDRLGIPLIEIGTAPDIKNPEHAKEVAEKLGMIIRSTGKSQRGIGVTRQDLNLSIKEGARIEIKGVQELGMISKIIGNEVSRQMELVKAKQSEEETRVANADGTTSYMRPLPGGQRMYPETDIPPIVITNELLSRIEIPETWEEKHKKFLKILPKELAEQVLWSEYLDLFEKFYKINPVVIANTFTSIIKDLRRRDFPIENLTKNDFKELFENLKTKKISKEAIPDILEIMCMQKISVEDAIKKAGFKKMTENELIKIAKNIFDKHPDLVKEKKISALMGEVMKEVRGKGGAEGKKLYKILKMMLNA